MTVNFVKICKRISSNPEIVYCKQLLPESNELSILVLLLHNKRDTFHG